MGENKGKGDEKEKKPVESEKEKNGGGSDKKKEGGVAEKKEEGPPKIVLRVDMHCEGCASKIKRCIKGFEGVEGVTLDMASNKLTVTGTADPWKLRDHVEVKTRKKVEILSPANQPKKDADGGKKAADGDKKAVSAGDSKDVKKPEDKKFKEPAASTVVLKIRLHCDGCIQRIKKTIFKIKGVQDVSVDAQKDLVTVKGTMDPNSLPPCLKEKLNRGVEIVSKTTGGGGGGGGGGGNEKKDKPAAAASGGDKKEKVGGDGEKKGNGSGGGGENKGNGGGGGGGGGEKKGNGSGGGGEKKGNGGGGGGEKKGNGGGAGGGGVGKEELPEATVMATALPVVEANKMDYYGGPYGHRAEMVHAPQLFSDENPNACSVM